MPQNVFLLSEDYSLKMLSHVSVIKVAIEFACVLAHRRDVGSLYT